MTKNNNDFKAIQVFIEGTNIISQKVNDFISFLDPPFYQGLKNLRKFTMKRIPGIKLFETFDALIMAGRSLIFNRQTPEHTDDRDLLVGWQVLIAGGHFTQGGSLYIPALRLRLRLLPGDMVAIRGRILAHEIEPWIGGQRISLVNFTHESVWKYVENIIMEEHGYASSTGFVGDVLMRIGSNEI